MDAKEKFTDVFGGSLPASRLALTFAFDLDEIVTSPSSSVHDAACKKAAAHLSSLHRVKNPCDCKFSGDRPSPFQARALIGRGLTLQQVHHSPFDPAFHVANGGPAIRFEFWYDQEEPKMFLRVVTGFGTFAQTIDGVLAARIGFHTIEVLEGQTMRDPIFPKPPPLHYGLRQQINFIRQVYGTQVFMFLANLWFQLQVCLQRIIGWNSETADPTRVTNILSYIRFYRSKQASDTTTYSLYHPDPKIFLPKYAFRLYLECVEAWRKTLGLNGFFYLCNFSPLVAAGTTTRIQDVASVSLRYKGVFDPITPPPPPFVWKVANSLISDKIIINNYGRHDHNFKARPSAFVWDWLHLASALHGTGCISINGVFLCWFRGMRNDHKCITLGIGNALGEPVTLLNQNVSWFPTMGNWKPIPD